MERKSRREFLKDVAAAGGAAAAVTVAGTAAATELDDGVEKSAGKPQGYQETPHVANYYEKARI